MILIVKLSDENLLPLSGICILSLPSLLKNFFQNFGGFIAALKLFIIHNISILCVDVIRVHPTIMMPGICTIDKQDIDI